ncbi:MAG: hypothetical protein L3J06_06685 [Cyclobacteriaceae bacterium]|nr:hypothetical protein [Cyclobacteriaceae bacterium]
MLSIKLRNFLTKLRAWEYWPMSLFYAPVYAYWFYLGVKARSIFFFTAANPGIKNGGMVAASKKSILDIIPNQYIPTTVLLSAPVYYDEVELAMQKSGLAFPVIFKPDVGERGWKVEKINDKKEAEAYLVAFNADLQMQEYLDLPFEAGVFYYRFPEEQKGTVSSIVVKELLHVIGDGKLTLKQLIINKPRARIQLAKLQKKGQLKFDWIPNIGIKVELQPIGNHNRGAAFLDGNHLICDQLINSFENISQEIEGFYYGRFDVRCKDEAALKRGDVKIMELNGAASEPAHIYQAGFSIFKAYQVLLHHWNILYQISIANHAKGTPYTSFKKGYKDLTTSGRIMEQGI